MLLVTNPVSGSADTAVLADVERALGRREAVTRLEPRSADTVAEEVSEGAEGHGLVVVAGGDGTFNGAVNALVDRRDDLVFALVPMGTGNDLVRTLGVPQDPVEAAASIAEGRRGSVDLAKAAGPGVERYFVNACMGGFPVAVNRAIDEDTKAKLGPVAFLWGGFKAAGDLERSTVTIDGYEVPDCVAVGVGNGRTCGGGIEVWPEADPDDGELEVHALPAENALAALKLGAKVRAGKHEELEDLFARRAKRIRVEATPGIEFNVDGELVDLRSPATFEIVGKLWMLLPAT